MRPHGLLLICAIGVIAFQSAQAEVKPIQCYECNSMDGDDCTSLKAQQLKQCTAATPTQSPSSTESSSSSSAPTESSSSSSEPTGSSSSSFAPTESPDSTSASTKLPAPTSPPTKSPAPPSPPTKSSASTSASTKSPAPPSPPTKSPASTSAPAKSPAATSAPAESPAPPSPPTKSSASTSAPAESPTATSPPTKSPASTSASTKSPASISAPAESTSKSNEGPTNQDSVALTRDGSVEAKRKRRNVIGRFPRVNLFADQEHGVWCYRLEEGTENKNLTLGCTEDANFCEGKGNGCKICNTDECNSATSNIAFASLIVSLVAALWLTK